MADRFICGDALEVLRTLPPESVQCCITSPPYWGLRDYGVEGQIGLEPTLQEYVEALVEVFREVRRVLRPDGTLWLNLGDSYAGSGKGAWDNKEVQKEVYVPDKDSPQCKLKKVPQGLKPKDLVGIPWMVAFALRADGWYLRQDIIWHKPNCMPESVKDRCTKAHEYIFLLSKSLKYYYDAEAIKEPIAASTVERAKSKNNASTRKDKGTAQWRSGLTPEQQDKWYSNIDKNTVRNKRDVWTVATTPFEGAHFATFPPDLVQPCILAGTSARGCCPECGAPYVREIVRTGHVNRRETAHVPSHCGTKTDSTGWAPTRVSTDNWSPTCTCNAGPPIPCTVLDPFGGSGTVNMVAKRFGRHSIYIDLNREYVDMAVRRTLGE